MHKFIKIIIKQTTEQFLTFTFQLTNKLLYKDYLMQKGNLIFLIRR